MNNSTRGRGRRLTQRDGAHRLALAARSGYLAAQAGLRLDADLYAERDEQQAYEQGRLWVAQIRLGGGAVPAWREGAGPSAYLVGLIRRLSRELGPVLPRRVVVS